MEEQVTERMIIRGTPEHCFDVLTSFEEYPEWAADIKSVSVDERDEEGRAVRVTFRAAAFGRSTSYTLRYDYHGAPDRAVVGAGRRRSHPPAGRLLRTGAIRGRGHRDHLSTGRRPQGAIAGLREAPGGGAHHGHGAARAEGPRRGLTPASLGAAVRRRRLGRRSAAGRSRMDSPLGWGACPSTTLSIDSLDGSPFDLERARGARGPGRQRGFQVRSHPAVHRSRGAAEALRRQGLHRPRACRATSSGARSRAAPRRSRPSARPPTA